MSASDQSRSFIPLLNRRKKIALVLFVTLVLVCGWDLMWWGLGVGPMLPWTLKKALDGKRENLVLVDVRPAIEYDRSHITGARHLPDLVSDPSTLGDDLRDVPVVVICTSGHTSPVVAYKLRRSGFKKVFNLTWGMVGWRVVSGSEKGKEGDR